MAQKTVVETYDDVSGERIDTTIVPNPTISFAIDGVEYEIELGAKNRDKFYATFDPYTKVARRTGGRRSNRKSAGVSNGSGGLSKAELSKIRDWAQENGRTAPARGRLPKELVEAYRQSNS
ncbi:histone-like nucleoid-structuring protein Lsr2 [Nocardia terpenica]|uniref:Lsr2 family protein n=1 Tax=Nocardia terpenica TaxID=455432 RepID=A0A6G9YXX0_9NOCA|nr:Lsr2 family protein [Nocardia terpenica]QIS18179.1 Lsr2 family protein [Nocardia terpenica]